MDIKTYAKENHVPIMMDEGLAFLLDYVKTNNVKSILELGTAIGYSAMNMAKISTHKLAPLKVTPPVICSTISFSSSLSGMMLKYFFKTLKMLLFPISDVFVQN